MSTKLEERVLFDGFHTITEVEAEIKGKKVLREKLGLKSAVAAIVIDETGRIGLVSQYRPAIARHIWEIPAGVLDKDLSNYQTLLEELEEECQITKEQVLFMDTEPVYKYFMVPGSSDAELSIYFVHVTKQEDKLVDDADVDMVRWFTLREFDELIESGQIVEGKTMIGYHFYRNWTNVTQPSI